MMTLTEEKSTKNNGVTEPLLETGSICNASDDHRKHAALCRWCGVAAFEFDPEYETLYRRG